MALDFELGRLSRRCTATERELAPGETVFSVLVSEDGAVVRQDFSAEAWSEPPEDAIGWWKSVVPDPKAKAATWAPNDILLHYFKSLDPIAQSDTRYVTALLLIRKRVLLEVLPEEAEPAATEEPNDETADTQAGDPLDEYEDPLGNLPQDAVMQLRCPKSDAVYQVAKVEPEPARIAAISDELQQLLTGDAPTEIVAAAEDDSPADADAAQPKNPT